MDSKGTRSTIPSMKWNLKTGLNPPPRQPATPLSVNPAAMPPSSQDAEWTFECSLHGCIHEMRVGGLLEKLIAILGRKKQQAIYTHEIVCLPSLGKQCQENGLFLLKSRI
jgi:hypothetical protein